MNITTDPNLWAICVLVFLLGLLIGVFLTAGGRRKWKERYNLELERRHELERDRDQRDRDSLHGAAVKNPAEERGP